MSNGLNLRAKDQQMLHGRIDFYKPLGLHLPWPQRGPGPCVQHTYANVPRTRTQCSGQVGQRQ
jgi:hypothetical protein